MAASLVTTDGTDLLLGAGGDLLYSESGDPTECCCDEMVPPEDHCECECTDTVPLVMTFQGVDAECDCWDGHEVDLEGNCNGGFIAAISPVGGDLAEPAGCTSLDQLTFNADCFAEAGWDITMGVSVGGGAVCGVTATNLELHSCSPFHLTGDLVIDTTAGNCGIWCGTNTETVTISFEILEA